MRLIISLLLFSSTTALGQEIQFQVKFSKPFAVFEFLSSLSASARPNPYKKEFNSSEYHSKKYIDGVAQFDSLNLDHSYEFTEYPQGQKVGGDIGSFLRRNLILSEDVQDFKQRSMGLIPNSGLIILCDLLAAFTPVYDSVIYIPMKQHFDAQIDTVSNIIRSVKLNFYFGQALQFFNSSWDRTIPFILCFYPLPHSRSWTATAISNVALSAVPDTLSDYNGLLSVMLHEVCHILYDEKPLSNWMQIDHWFVSNPSKCMRYAYSLFNEAMATAVGNGYFHTQLAGKENKGNWYGSKYINLMAKQIYPVVKEYITNQRSIDSDFIAGYIHLYDQNFSSWLTEMDNLMYGGIIMSEAPEDFQLFNRKFRSGHKYENEISKSSLQKLENTTSTKIIIVNTDQKEKLRLIRQNIAELHGWHYNEKKDFIYSLFLKDRTWLIIFNNVKGTAEEKLQTLVLKEPIDKMQPG